MGSIPNIDIPFLGIYAYSVHWNSLGIRLFWFIVFIVQVNSLEVGAAIVGPFLDMHWL